MNRPYPPTHLCSPLDRFEPAPDVAAWLRETFILDGSPLHNPDHEHLQMAEIGVLWTSVEYNRQRRAVAGTAEIPKPHPALSGWQKARYQQQLVDWFGRVPHFLLTFYAPYCAEIDDASWCALVEHECYHCAQCLDEYGFPKFKKKTGEPVFGIRGHDAEEHIGVVRRYGLGAAAGGVRELVEAAMQPPLVAPARIAAACGTCSIKF